MNKNKLLSIGQLSKQTGVNIGSLRYYDQLGILPPAYVDIKSGYRYYSFPQIYIVEAIQFCVELDIPLKSFYKFSQEGEGKINFTELIEQGRIRAKEKIKISQNKLKTLERLQGEISHGELCNSSKHPQLYTLNSKLCWVTPNSQQLVQDKVNMQYSKMVLDMNKHKITAGYEIGTLTFWSNSQVDQFLYVEISSLPNMHYENSKILNLPASDYLCVKSDIANPLDAPNIFPSLFDNDYDKVVLTRELFINGNDFFNPIYEICCSVPNF